VIRGISFIIPNEYGKWLFNILKPIEVENYDWFIQDNCEIYEIKNKSLENQLFSTESNFMEGTKIKELIQDKQYYVIFAEMKAYLNGERLNQNFKTYDEFLNSNCELLFLIADSKYTRIYCKDEIKLKKLFLNAESLNLNDIQYLDDKNDLDTYLTLG